MSDRPDYLVHTVDERALTVDWFFGEAPRRTKLVQAALALVGWVFTVLPIVVTASAMWHRHDQSRGWWNYREGFAMWDTALTYLTYVIVIFVVVFLALHLYDRALTRRNARRVTYHEKRLEQRLEVAELLLTEKFGPAALRHGERRVQIEPYADLETYELRDLFRAYEID